MRAAAIGLLALALALALPARAQEPASAAIVLLIDYSQSVTAAELAWQVGGLIDVFADDAVEDRLASTDRGWVAVTVVRYATEPELPAIIPWTVLRAGDGSVAAFREQLIRMAAADRPPGPSTFHDRALTAAFDLLRQAPPADRQIVDLQTDDINTGTVVQARAEVMRTMRARAWAENVILNVIMIGEPGSTQRMAQATLDGAVAFHEANTVSGTVWIAFDQESYTKALLTKILGEISDATSPTPRSSRYV